MHANWRTVSRARPRPCAAAIFRTVAVKAGVSIEQLAESIALRTLLQSLNVRAILDADGKETGMFEVPAGGRRYRALELLVNRIDPGHSCAVEQSGHRAIAGRIIVADDIEPIALSPHGDDFNDDLRRFGIDKLRTAFRVQLAPEDVARFMLL